MPLILVPIDHARIHRIIYLLYYHLERTTYTHCNIIYNRWRSRPSAHLLLLVLLSCQVSTLLHTYTHTHKTYTHSTVIWEAAQKRRRVSFFFLTISVYYVQWVVLYPSVSSPPKSLARSLSLVHSICFFLPPSLSLTHTHTHTRTHTLSLSFHVSRRL